VRPIASSADAPIDPVWPSSAALVAEGLRLRREGGGRTDFTGRPLLAAMLLASARPATVLDVGGKGGWLREYLRRADPEARVVGVDLEPRGRAMIAGDARRLPIADRAFDAVALLDVIEHLPARTEPAALSEACRVLRPGGLLVLSTPAAWRLGRWSDPQWWAHGHRHYKPSEVEAMVIAAGFDVRSTAARGTWSDVVGLPLMYVTKGQWMLERGWREYGRPGRYTLFVVARKR
jgi:SAM-dependent methyltransferase